MSKPRHLIPKRGRPAVDSELVRARLGRPVLEALDAWAAGRPGPKPTRPQAIRMVLREWAARRSAELAPPMPREAEAAAPAMPGHLRMFLAYLEEEADRMRGAA